MKLITFSNRNMKDIVRDPLTLAFGLGFPLVLLLLLSVIQSNIPVSLFEIDELTPGISVFGLSFMTLFSSMIIAKDRETALLQRLYTTPLTAVDFIIGYALPVIPISLAQALICYAAAFFLGLEITINILFAILMIIPVALFNIALGLLFGSVLNTKQVGGFCGALLTNLTAWLSGIWFDLELAGGAFKKISYCLPFVHAVDMEKAIVAGNYSDILPHLQWVLGYTAVLMVLAVAAFLRQMKKQ